MQHCTTTIDALPITVDLSSAQLEVVSGGGADAPALEIPSSYDGVGPAVLRGLGVQLLLFAGFEVDASGRWALSSGRRNASLGDRVGFIAPTWKGGVLEYGSLTRRGWGLDGVTSAGHLSAALARVGLKRAHYDGAATSALRAMLDWRLPEPSDSPPPSRDEPVALLVFAFDATPDCRSVDDCPRPGPTNELLAANSVVRFDVKLSSVVTASD